MAQDALIDGNLITDARPLAVEVQNDTLAVEGPLTDAELRATAVPVSGPLTDAELRATPPAVEAQARAGGVLTTPRLDAATSSMQVISYPHHEIHSGSSFSVSAEDVDLDEADELSISFTTGAGTKWLHMFAIAANSAACEFEILEAPTITLDTGTDLTPYNRNRNSETLSTMYSIKTVPVVNQATRDATITNDGTVIWLETMGGYKNASASAGASSREEWVLAPATVYSFRITGIADNGVASIGLHWYEHTDVA